MDGTCDVAKCPNKTYMGWGPKTERLGKQICEYHWNRHKDPNDDFDLFDAFGLRRPAGIRKPATKKQVIRCACGRERLPGRKYCTECAAERERQRKKRAYHKRKNEGGQPAVQPDILRCKACGAERESGHTFCRKCSRERKRQTHQERQRRYRQRHAQAVKV